MVAEFKQYHAQFVRCHKDGTLIEDIFNAKHKCKRTGDYCVMRECPKLNRKLKEEDTQDES